METLASGSAAPAIADNTGQVETTEADAKVVEANADGSAPSVPEADTPAPKDKVQERIDKLTREKYDALRERDRHGYEVESLRERLKALETAKPAEVAPQNDFPTLEQYGFDEPKFQAAVAAHIAKITREQGAAAAQEALRAERAAEQERKAGEGWAKKQADFIKSKPDYADKVMRSPRDGGPVVTNEMAQVMRESEVGPAIAYYLAENVDQSALIAQMPPLQQAREIGRIEAKLEAAKAPPKPVVSQAPPPPSRIDADEAPVTVKVDSADSDTLSDKEWTRRRNLQEQARRRKASS
jgi:hypothetical protein